MYNTAKKSNQTPSVWDDRVGLADKYHHVRHDEGLRSDVPPTPAHDGSAGLQNKACRGQTVNLNQMDHFIIAQQLDVNVVLGSHMSAHLVSP